MRIAALLVPALMLGQQTAPTNPRTSPADVAAGARLFRSHCAECHGVQGEGGRGPNLTTGVFYHGDSDADLFRNVSEGIPGTLMPGVFAPPDQVWQMIAYVRTLSRTGSADRPPGDAARGARLFREKECITCHLVRGEGGAQGPDLSVIGSQRSVEHLRESILDPGAKVAREYRVAKVAHRTGASYSGFLLNEDTHTVQLLDFSKGLVSLSRRDLRKFDIDPSSAMPTYQGRLNQEELNDLMAYLWSLQRPRGSP